MLKMGILDRLRNLNKNQPDVFQETWFEKCNNAYGCYRTRSSSDANTANLHIEEGMSIEWIERFPDLPFKLANVKAYYYSGPKNVLLLDDADISLAYNLIASTKPIFIDSYNLVPEIFSERIAKNRIDALESVQSVLDEMISFEDIELLLKDKSLINGCPNVKTTIAMLHGFSGANKYFVQLAECLSTYSKYLPNNLRAILINTSHLQKDLLDLLIQFFKNEEEKDYLFVLATYPIAEDLKKYVREAQGIIADCLNTTNVVSEAQTGEGWDRLFDENKKRTSLML